MEVIDRYSGTATPTPDPWTGCKSCSGMGLHFMEFGEWLRMGPGRPPIVVQEDERGVMETIPPAGGSLVIHCEACNGIGVRPFAQNRLGDVLAAAYTYYYRTWFPFWATKQEPGFRLPENERPTAKTYITDFLYWWRFAGREQKLQRRAIRRNWRNR